MNTTIRGIRLLVLPRTRAALPIALLAFGTGPIVGAAAPGQEREPQWPTEEGSRLQTPLEGQGQPISGLRIHRLPSLDTPRAAHQATKLHGGRVLVTGGCFDDGCDRSLATSLVFDPGKGSFSEAASMTMPRRDHAAVLLDDGRVLVAGGWSQAPTATAEIYDPEADRWRAVGSMTEARSGAVGVALPDGRVLFVGGYTARGRPAAAGEVFDPATETFAPAGDMQTLRRRMAAVGLSDGRVLVTGGGSADGRVLRSAEIFDPATNEFLPTGSMAQARWTHSAVLLPDGKVMVIGGSTPASSGPDDRIAETELYDPSSGSFSPGPGLQIPRRKISGAVAVLTRGAVLVAGGAAKAEVWEPGLQSFALLDGELSGRMEFASTTLLDSGDVLVVGGYDETIRPSAGVWLVR